MSASAVEPGTRLADRFRLEDRVAETGGATLWKAIDEILARPVAVHTFAPDFERVHEVVTAARAASRLSDPRLTQVFDAAEENDLAYVVSEWVDGETLADLVISGPLDPERAGALVAEAAEALAHAHEAGLVHLCLRPDQLIWTKGGTVKLLGVAVDAVLGDILSDDPARDDAEGLGRLLYAGLTGHWPGEADETELPPAPKDDGHYCAPRQVTAGVPGYLDTITCRILLPETRRGLIPLVTPAEVADALTGVPRPAPVPLSSLPPAVLPSHDDVSRFEMSMPGATVPAPAPPRPPMRPPQPKGVVGRVVTTVVVLLVMAAVGLGAWTLGRSIGAPSAPVAQPTPTPTPSAEPKIVKPVGAAGFDPLGDGEENGQYAALAIDGKPSTDWHTQTYVSADLGRLKEGVGLLVDLGKETRIGQVLLTLADAPGATVEIKVGDRSDLSALTTVATQKNARGKVTMTPEADASGQYVLIWFTRLPNDQGKFRGTIYDVVVYSPGSA
jgi:hypothetical protein